MADDVLGEVLASAAKLQTLVPDAVLVGGSAAAFQAGHRDSFDHDHVLTDLAERYVEAGLRQLRRTRPLEFETVDIESRPLRVPTLEECLRVKAYLVVQRNVVRDYLDTVALADRIGAEAASSILAQIDDFYADRSEVGDSVATALVQRLSEPNPRDTTVTEQLPRYKGIVPKWHRWSAVVRACADLADGILRRFEDAT